MAGEAEESHIESVRVWHRIYIDAWVANGKVNLVGRSRANLALMDRTSQRSVARTLVSRLDRTSGRQRLRSHEIITIHQHPSPSSSVLINCSLEIATKDLRGHGA